MSRLLQETLRTETSSPSSGGKYKPCPTCSGAVGDKCTCQLYTAGRNGRNGRKSHQNLQEGDVVLVTDNQAVRNNWPLTVITKAIPGEDGEVRKVELKTTDQGHSKHDLRPVTELVLLLRKE